MIRRLLLGVFIALVSGAWFGGHGGGGSSAPGDPLAVLIANTINTCGHGCWVHLSAPNSGPSAAMQTYGYTTANFNFASNDPWPDGSTPNVGGGNDAALFSYSAPGIRSDDGKICAVGTGGHTASAVSAVFCFNTAAAAANINAGGAGGAWYIAVKPARFSSCNDPRPAWQPQGFCDTASLRGAVGWTNTNPNGQQMPISCHEYWSNRWIPGTHHLIWSGFFCGYNGGNTIGGAGWYDDDTPLGTDSGTMHFPVVTNPAYMGWTLQGGGSNMGPGTFNDLDKCWYDATSDQFHDYNGFKWCNIDTTPVWSATFGTGQDGPGNNIQAIIVPDPSAPTTKRWFLQWGGNTNCYNSGFPCFLSFKGIGGTVAYQRLIFTTAMPITWNGATLSNGLCYDPALNAIIASLGTQHLYKIGDRNNGGAVTNDLSNWGFVEYTSNPGGITPGASFDSGSPWSCASLEPNYPAILIAGVNQSTGQMEVDWYVK